MPLARDLPAITLPTAPVDLGTRLATFAEAEAQPTTGRVLRALPAAARDFRAELKASGRPEYVGTFDLYTFPYPKEFGLWRAAFTPAPFLVITNRLLVVRWHDGDGRRRTLLFEPSDVDLGYNTPYFADLAARTPPPLRAALVTRHGGVLEHLARLGVAPEEVDYLVYDHLHTQDVRRWIGTTTPQPDLSLDAPVAPAFPNARLVVQRRELEAMCDLHPLQRPWYQVPTFVDLRPEGLAPIEGDVLLGPGVALLSTPGHTLGNQSLVLNTDSGIWVSSENAVAAECMTPEHSRIPGVARWASRWGQEVVLNANTLEAMAEQYNSMIKEKHVADTSRDGRFVQFLPSSELTRSRIAPGAGPTVTHLGISHGSL